MYLEIYDPWQQINYLQSRTIVTCKKIEHELCDLSHTTVAKDLNMPKLTMRQIWIMLT